MRDRQTGIDFFAAQPITKATNPTTEMDAIVFTPASSRAAHAYQVSSVETVVQSASPHQLIVLLFDGLLQSIHHASGALQRQDRAVFGQQVGRAVRILDEGLKGALNLEQGGEVAANLRALYDYCVRRMTQANLHHDGEALAEVARLIAPVAESWKQIGGAPAVAAPVPHAAASAVSSAAGLSFHQPEGTGAALHKRTARGVAAYAQGA